MADLIKLTDIQKFQFFKLHKSLFTIYRGKLSLQAKVLYSLLCDRLELSIQNEWCDEDGYAYLIFTRAEMAYLLDVTEKTAIKAMKELIDCGLVYEKRQYKNKPNLIYLRHIETSDVTPAQLYREERKMRGSQAAPVDPDIEQVQIEFEDKLANNEFANESKSTTDDVSMANDSDEISEQFIRTFFKLDDYIEKPFRETVFSVIFDVVHRKRKSYFVDGVPVDAELIRRRFLLLDESDVRYAYDQYLRDGKRVTHLRHFILSTLNRSYFEREDSL